MSRKKKEKDRIGALLEFVEKDRVGILGAFIIIFVFGFLRSVLEATVFEYPADSLYLRANHVALYFAMFMTGVLIITFFSGINGRKVFNTVLFGWFIILTPPIIDLLMGHGGFGNGYPYSETPNILVWIRNAFDIDFISKIGYGEFFQLYSIVILSAIYVFLRKKSIIRAVLTGVFLFLFIAYVAVSMTFILEFSTNSGEELVLLQYFHFPLYARYYPKISTTMISFMIQQQTFLFVAFYYTLLFLLSSLLFMYIYSKERTMYFLRSIKWKRILSVIALVYLGVYMAGILAPEYPLHEIYIGFAAIASVSAAQFWNMMEDLSSTSEKSSKKRSKKSDERNMPVWDAPYSKKQYRNVAIAFLILSLCSSYLLGYGPFIMTIIFLFTAYLYTSKPFEGWKTSIAPFIFALYALFPFLTGFYTPSYWLIKVTGPHLRVYDPSMMKTIYMPVGHPLTMTVIVSLAVIYAIAFIMKIMGDGRKSTAENSEKS